MTPLGAVTLLCFSLQVLAQDDHGENVPSYTSGDFETHLSDSANFVMFFAPWCGHCQALAPTWDELAKIYNVDKKDSKVKIAKVDCTTETPLCSAHGVTGYPTLKFFQQGSDDGVKFKGQRTIALFEEFIQKQLKTEAEAENPQPPEPKKSLVELTTENFDANTKFGHNFIKFYAPWCGHCQKLAPVWDQLAETFQHTENVHISKVDCTQQKPLCDLYEVKGYPTLLFFTNGQPVDKYKGGRDIDALKSYVSNMMEQQDANVRRTDEQIPERTEEPVKAESNVIKLTDETFSDVIATGITFIKFYAPWCGHCKRLAPTWEELANKLGVKTIVKIAHLDCDDYKFFCREQNIQGYPTLFLYKDGQYVQEYSGSRDFEELHQFIMDNLPHDEL